MGVVAGLRRTAGRGRNIHSDVAATAKAAVAVDSTERSQSQAPANKGAVRRVEPASREAETPAIDPSGGVEAAGVVYRAARLSDGMSSTSRNRPRCGLVPGLLRSPQQTTFSEIVAPQASSMPALTCLNRRSCGGRLWP